MHLMIVVIGIYIETFIFLCPLRIYSIIFHVSRGTVHIHNSSNPNLFPMQPVHTWMYILNQRRTTGCFLNVTVFGISRLVCIHNWVELRFFTELVDIIVATCSWLAERRSKTSSSLGSVLLGRRRFPSVPDWPIASEATEFHKVGCPSYGYNDMGPKSWSLSRRLVAQIQGKLATKTMETTTATSASAMRLPIPMPTIPRTADVAEVGQSMNSSSYFSHFHVTLFCQCSFIACHTSRGRSSLLFVDFRHQVVCAWFKNPTARCYPRIAFWVKMYWKGNLTLTKFYDFQILA